MVMGVTLTDGTVVDNIKYTTTTEKLQFLLQPKKGEGLLADVNRIVAVHTLVELANRVELANSGEKADPNSNAGEILIKAGLLEADGNMPDPVRAITRCALKRDAGQHKYTFSDPRKNPELYAANAQLR